MEPTKDYNLRKNPRPSLRKLESFALYEETSSTSTSIEKTVPEQHRANIEMEDSEGTGSDQEEPVNQKVEGTSTWPTLTTQPTVTSTWLTVPTQPTTISTWSTATTQSIVTNIWPTAVNTWPIEVTTPTSTTTRTIFSALPSTSTILQPTATTIQNTSTMNQPTVTTPQTDVTVQQTTNVESHNYLLTQIGAMLIQTQKHLEEKFDELENKFGDTQKQLNNKLHELENKIDLNQHKNELVMHNYQEEFTTHIKNVHIRIDDINNKVALVTETVNNITSQVENQVISKLDCHSIEVEQKLQENHQICQNMVVNHNKNMLKQFEETTTCMTNMVKDIKLNTEQNNTTVNTLKRQVQELEQRKINNPPNIYVTCNSSKSTELLPKFNGRNKNPVEFLNSLRNYLNHPSRRDLPSTDYEDILDSCLEEHAARWWNLMKQDTESFDQFETIFLEKYWNYDIQRGIRRRMELEKYRPQGKLNRTEYFVERVIIYRNMTPTISDEEIVTSLSEHFDELIQNACRVQNVTTIKGMERLLTRADLDDKNQKLKIQPLIHKTNRPNYPNVQQYPRPTHETRRSFDNTPPSSSNHRYNPYQQGYSNKNTQNVNKPPGNYNYPRPSYHNYPINHVPTNNNNHSNPDRRVRPNSPRTEGRTYYNKSYPTDEQRNVCQLFAKQSQDSDEKPKPEQDTENPPLNK